MVRKYTPAAMDEYPFPPLPEEEFQRLSPEEKLQYLQAAYRSAIGRNVYRAVDCLDMPDQAPVSDYILQ
jgi:hypothetical protein